MIGYYVHHHGAGHAHRFTAVRRHMPELVGLGSGPRPPGIDPGSWVELPLDVTEPTHRDPTAGEALHWAPLREQGLRACTAAITDWIAAHDPLALVVDVSVEVALLARLLSVPTVVVAQHGDRGDLPHELAYRSAAAVAALWNPGDIPAPPGAAGKLEHVGPISRFDGWPTRPKDHHGESGRRVRVLLLAGFGGTTFDGAQITAAIAATAGRCDWDVIGPIDGAVSRRVDAPAVWEALGSCDIVVAPASNNCVAEVAAAGPRLIALPQPRPFDEQLVHAGVLRRRGLATVLDAWPEPERWPELIDDVLAVPTPSWPQYHDGLGGERLAAIIEREATR